MMATATVPDWRQRCNIFAEKADDYDRWFDGNPIFMQELAAIRALLPYLQRPAVEIGIGPGRFAKALGVKFGIDQALPPLAHCRKRNILTAAGIGEALPIRTGVVGTCLLLLTLCFVKNPATVLRECHRVLRPAGTLIIGMIPADSPWGRNIRQKQRDGNIWYRFSHLATIAATRQLLERQGFRITDYRSTLLQTPDKTVSRDHVQQKLDEQAGFCVIAAQKEKTACLQHNRITENSSQTPCLFARVHPANYQASLLQRSTAL